MLGHCTLILTLFLSILRSSFFLSLAAEIMASFNRGQPPARQTKVVHHGFGCIKAGSTGLGSDCRNDDISLKPSVEGRGMADAQQSNVTKCGSDRCKTCNHLVEGNSFTSNLTKVNYNVVSPNDDMDCGTSNVVYLISCNRCGVQYIGKTSQTLRSRFNNHRNRLKHLCDLYLYNHFNSDGHSLNDIAIMPIEEVKLAPNENTTISAKLLSREEFWYKEIGSVYPYGLNDNVRRLGNVSKQIGKNLVVYSIFNKQARKFHRRSRKRRKHKVDGECLRQRFKVLLDTYKSPTFSHNIRTFLCTLPKRWLRQVWHVTEEFQLDDKIPSRIAMLVRDIVASRNKVHMGNKEVSSDNKMNRMYLNVLFHNKGIEMINIPGILHNRIVSRTVPDFIENQEAPTVSYTYTKTISSKIFNFKNAIKNIDFDVGTSDMTCKCSSSAFNYTPAGHVVTGDLNIIEDRPLRQLLMKGPAFREQNNINWELNRHICKKAVRKYKEKWARRDCVDKRVFDDWEQTVCNCIDDKIERLKRKVIHKRKKQVLNNKKHNEFLKRFHEDYVLVPADKASNNIIVVCKRYYIEVMLHEFRNNVGNNQRTYEEVHADNDGYAIVCRHIVYMKSKSISIPHEMEQLPCMYWLPKLHKTPFGSRFIAASNKCTTKPLSRLLTACLTTIMIHFKEYCDGIFRNTGVNCFWIINNSQQVLSSLSYLNKVSRAKHFDSFDFTTLYTNIPHDTLKTNLGALIEEAFKVRGAKYLSINKRNGAAYWAVCRSSNMCIDKNELLELLTYLVDNIFVVLGNRIYRQCIGIPMGTDCAPLLANLFLFYYEYAYMKGLMKNDFRLAKRFNNTVRYIDDLLALNNMYFAEEIPNIYPAELVLKKTTESLAVVSYLDISITIGNNKFWTSVFDKRDSFNFHIFHS